MPRITERSLTLQRDKFKYETSRWEIMNKIVQKKISYLVLVNESMYTVTHAVSVMMNGKTN